MAYTYGESWALFHDDEVASRSVQQAGSFDEVASNEPSLASSTISGRCSPRSRPQDSPAATDREDLVEEVQRLRQELSDLKRTGPSNVLLDPPNCPQPGITASANGYESRQAVDESGIPRCWDPCCNGRIFSNQSNLARHQREKHGQNAKLRCSFCNAVFSRSSARNAHEAERRCRTADKE